MLNGAQVDLPPHDPAAEQSVLGALMLNRDVILDVAGVLDVADFYLPRHQAVYDCVLDLHSRGEPVDPITVSAELERRGELGRVGGGPYLHTLTAIVPTATNAGYYAEIVADKAKARRLIEAGTRLAARAAMPGVDLDELRAEHQAAIATHTPGGKHVDRLVTGGSFILDEPADTPALWGYGPLVLWAEGEGFMIAGQQGVGKTTVGQQVVAHMIGIRTGPLLGLPVAPAAGRVLYLAMDRPRQAARSFARMVTNRHRELLDERLEFWKGPLPVNVVATPSAFATWVLRQCPDVTTVVVDSVKDMAAGIAKDEIGSALNLAWQELIAQGVDLLLLHHGRKAQNGAKRGKSLDDVYGSTWLTSGLGSVLLLDGDPGSDLITAHHVKQPAEAVPEFVIRHDAARGVSIRHGDDIPTVIQQLVQAGPAGVTAADVAMVQYGSNTEANQRKAKRHLSKLIAQGDVEIVAGEHRASGREPSRYIAIGAV